MLLPRAVAWVFPLGLMVLGTGVVCGQNYPAKPIHIFTSSAGSGVDFAARLIAQGLGGTLGQQVIVNNRSGNIPAETVSKAPPDGYTVLVTGTNTWVEPLLGDSKTYSYDVARDLLPVTLAAWQPGLLVVHPSLPVKSVKELIVLARARPGDLNSASAQRGALNHLAAEMFKSMAEVKIVNIRYSSTTLALTSLIGGEVQLSFPTAGAAVPHIKSGRLRGLAVTSAEPSELFPELPTVAASLPGYEAVSITAIFVPAKTPQAIVNLLNQEIVRVLNQPDVKGKFSNAGIAVVASSPDQLAAKVKSEVVRMGKVIRDERIGAR